MTGMTIPSVDLWNWYIDGLVAPVEIHTALVAVLARPVVPLHSADPARLPASAVLCDVWHTRGEFPTSVDCYGPPAGLAETTAAAGLACRLGRRCLLPDDTLDPGRFLLATPDGTLRPVHARVDDTDDGTILSELRPCTVADGRPRELARCRQSRWGPDCVVPGLTAAA